MNDYEFTLWKLLIREKLIESLSIHLNGMKCKYYNRSDQFRLSVNTKKIEGPR